MKKIILNRIGLFALFLLSLVGIVNADVGDYSGGCGMMGSGYWGVGMWFFGAIITLLVIVALVLLILWLIKQIVKK